MTHTLKGGFETTDRRLDRLPEFDEKSRQFPIRTLVAQEPLRSRTFPCPAWLDQGSEGACVGFSWSHELNAYPARNVVDENFARYEVYRPAQRIDEWPGEEPAMSGTSVLAGARILKSLGYFDEFRWAFSVDESLRAMPMGPQVIGVVWMGSMFNTRPSGLLEVSKDPNDIAGGHAICVRGLTLKPRLIGESRTLEPVIRLRNSWGKGWGKSGDCFIKVTDYEWLLKQQGECCIPVGRKLVKRV
jgi:hypothetical protein